MSNNVFTTKLKSIILPGNPSDFENEMEYLESVSRIFLVMDLMEFDMKKLIQDSSPADFD